MSVLLELLGDLLGDLVFDPMIELGKAVFRRPRSEPAERSELPEPGEVTESASEQNDPRFNEHPYLPGGPQ